MNNEEKALNIAGDLIAPEDAEAYSKAFETIGEERYAAIANIAHNSPKKGQLFKWLVNEELRKFDN